MLFEILKGAISLGGGGIKIESFSCFNAYFIVFLSFLKMPNKSKSKGKHYKEMEAMVY